MKSAAWRSQGSLRQAASVRMPVSMAMRAPHLSWHPSLNAALQPFRSRPCTRRPRWQTQRPSPHAVAASADWGSPWPGRSVHPLLHGLLKALSRVSLVLGSAEFYTRLATLVAMIAVYRLGNHIPIPGEGAVGSWDQPAMGSGRAGTLAHPAPFQLILRCPQAHRRWCWTVRAWQSALLPCWGATRPPTSSSSGAGMRVSMPAACRPRTGQGRTVVV